MPKKMKSLEEIAEKHGDEDFIDAVGEYTFERYGTVAEIIERMSRTPSSRFPNHTLAELMLGEYNDGILTIPINQANFATVDMGQADRTLLS